MTTDVSQLTRLVAAHATGPRAAGVADVLCEQGDPTTVSDLIIRVPAPAQVITRAVERLCSTDWDNSQSRDVTPARLRVAQHESLPAAAQMTIIGLWGTECVAIASHTTHPEVIRQLVGRTAKYPFPNGLTADHRQQEPGTGPVHALVRMAERAYQQPEFATLLADAGMGAAVAAILATPHHPCAWDLLRYWGTQAPEEVSALLDASTDKEIVSRAAALGWVAPRVRAKALGWVCDAIRSGTGDDPAFDALSRLESRLTAAELTLLREAAANSVSLKATRREGWLLRLLEDPDLAAGRTEVGRWATVDPVLGARELAALGHRLSHDAAVAFVARPDVGTALAHRVAVGSDHHFQDWVQVRAFDLDFVAQLLTAKPGWFQHADVTAELLVRVIKTAVARDQRGALQHIGQEYGRRLSREQYLGLSWRELHTHAEYDPAAATTLADALAQVLTDPLSTQALLQLLDSEQVTCLPARDILAAATTGQDQ